MVITFLLRSTSACSSKVDEGWKLDHTLRRLDGYQNDGRRRKMIIEVIMKV